jgi:hypothetical protein
MGGGTFSVGVLPALFGYIVINGGTIAGAMKAAMASVYALKSSLTIKGLLIAKTAGLNYFNY